MQVTKPRQTMVRQTSPGPQQMTGQRTRVVVDSVDMMMQEVRRDMQKKENLKTRLKQRLKHSKDQFDHCQGQTSEQEETAGRLNGANNRNGKQVDTLKLEMKSYEAKVEAFELDPHSVYMTLVNQTTDQLQAYNNELSRQRAQLVNFLLPQLQALRVTKAQIQTVTADIGLKLKSLETEIQSLQIVEKDMTGQLEAQERDRDCLQAELQDREAKLKEADASLTALDIELDSTRQKIVSSTALLQEQAAHTQTMLDTCIVHTTETQQSVAEMELSREELVRQLHDRQGGFDRAVMVLKNTLQSIAHTKNELKELRYQEEQTNNHLAMVLQPAEEAVRAQLTTVNTELESLQSTLEQMRAWEDKIRSGEEALTQLRAAEQSLKAQVAVVTAEQELRSQVAELESAVEAAREDKNQALVTVAAFQTAYQSYQSDLADMPMPSIPASLFEELDSDSSLTGVIATPMLVEKVSSNLAALKEYGTSIISERAALDHFFALITPQAEDIARLTQQLEECASHITAAEVTINMLQPTEDRTHSHGVPFVFSPHELAELEQQVAARLEQQQVDMDRLNKPEIADLQHKLQELSDSACKEKLANMQQLHDDELDGLRDQIHRAEQALARTRTLQQQGSSSPVPVSIPVPLLAASSSLRSVTSDSNKTRTKVSAVDNTTKGNPKQPLKPKLSAPHSSQHEPHLHLGENRSFQFNKDRVESAIARSLSSAQSQSSIFDFEEDHEGAQDSTRVDSFHRSEGSSANSSMSISTKINNDANVDTSDQLMDISSLHESLPILSRTYKGKGHEKDKASDFKRKDKARSTSAVDMSSPPVPVETLGSISPIDSANNSVISTNSSADHFLLGFSSSRKDYTKTEMSKKSSTQQKLAVTKETTSTSSIATACNTATTTTPKQTLGQKTHHTTNMQVPGAPIKAKKPRMLPSYSLEATPDTTAITDYNTSANTSQHNTSGNTVHFSRLSGVGKGKERVSGSDKAGAVTNIPEAHYRSSTSSGSNTHAFTHRASQDSNVKAKAQPNVQRKKPAAAASSPGDWFFDDQQTLF